MLEEQDDAELMSLATGQSLSASDNMLSQQYHHQQQGSLNDSLLAQLTQQELDSALETDSQLREDWLLAQDFDMEQQRLKEEDDFKKLQVRTFSFLSKCHLSLSFIQVGISICIFL